MKMIKIMPIATGLVVAVLHSSVSAGSQDHSSDDEEVTGIFRAPPAAQKKRTHAMATTTTFAVPAPKKPRAPQKPVFIIEVDEHSPPASGSSTCDPADAQEETTPEERHAQIVGLFTPEFRGPEHHGLIESFVWGFQDGRVFQRILTELRRIDTEKRFFAMNFVTSRLQYPHLLDEDEDEIIEALQEYDGSEIIVPRTPPATPRR